MVDQSFITYMFIIGILSIIIITEKYMMHLFNIQFDVYQPVNQTWIYVFPKRNITNIIPPCYPARLEQRH